MSNRSLLFLLLLALAVFLAVKFDLPTQVKIGVTNLIYGDEIKRISGFGILAEVPNQEIEREGLTAEKVRGGLIAALEKAGVKSLTHEQWQKAPGKPSLSISIQAVKQPEGAYQYTIILEATRIEAKGAAPGEEKSTTIWSASEIGQGNVSEIIEKIGKITDVFLKARSGG